MTRLQRAVQWAAVAAAAVATAAAATAPRRCGLASAGAWHGAARPYEWRTADGCAYPVGTLFDFQLAFAGRSLVIMGDSVSRDVALSAPMRYAGCDALERAGLQAEAVLGPDAVAGAWCPARRLFHHQKVHEAYTFAFPPASGAANSSGGRGGRGAGDAPAAATGATLEYHWSRFLRDVWKTPAWRRFVVDGDFVVGRDALVFNALFWHLALAHEQRFGMRTLTLPQLFPQWRRELDETVRALAASPHAARLRDAVFWRTATWREWPGKGRGYQPAFDNFHINNANRYARARFKKAGFRVIETEKYSFHATRTGRFTGADADLVLTKDSVHFPAPVNLALFRELASVVHTETHHLWRGPLADAVCTGGGGGGGGRAARDPALSALRFLVQPPGSGGGREGEGGAQEVPAALPVEEEDEVPAALPVAVRGEDEPPGDVDAALADDDDAAGLDGGGNNASTTSTSLSLPAGGCPTLDSLCAAHAVSSWAGASTVSCPLHLSGSSGGGEQAPPPAPVATATAATSTSSRGGGQRWRRLVLLDEATLLCGLVASAALGALLATWVAAALSRRPRGAAPGAGAACGSGGSGGGWLLLRLAAAAAPALPPSWWWWQPSAAGGGGGWYQPAPQSEPAPPYAAAAAAAAAADAAAGWGGAHLGSTARRRGGGGGGHAEERGGDEAEDFTVDAKD